MDSDSRTYQRGTCAFCENYSDYVLTVDDPGPENEKVIDSQLALPVCVNHLSSMKEANLNGA